MFNQGLGKPQMTVEDRICDMMMQLDEHSDKIPEGMYLQFCDHLKVFHQNVQMNRKHRQKLVAQEAEVAALRVEAEGGDAVAMRILGFSYRDGSLGLKTDLTQAFTWLKRAADLKDVYGLTECGVAYLNGDGVERSNIRGCTMIGIAAGMGSEAACGLLGLANAEGRWGFDKDPQEATRLYREMQKCTCRNSNEEYLERAAAWLREHP